MTRLRYVSLGGGVFESKNDLLAGTQLLKVFMYDADHTFKVSTLNGEDLVSGEADSMVNLKNLVRFVLQDLGVNFQEEIRQGKIKEEVHPLTELNDDFVNLDEVPEEVA